MNPAQSRVVSNREKILSQPNPLEYQEYYGIRDTLTKNTKEQQKAINEGFRAVNDGINNTINESLNKGFGEINESVGKAMNEGFDRGTKTITESIGKGINKSLNEGAKIINDQTIKNHVNLLGEVEKHFYKSEPIANPKTTRKIKGWKKENSSWHSIGSKRREDSQPYVVYIINYSHGYGDIDRYQAIFGQFAGHAIPITNRVTCYKKMAISDAIKFMEKYPTVKSQDKYFKKNYGKKKPHSYDTYGMIEKKCLVKFKKEKGITNPKQISNPSKYGKYLGAVIFTDFDPRHGKDTEYRIFKNEKNEYVTVIYLPGDPYGEILWIDKDYNMPLEFFRIRKKDIFYSNIPQLRIDKRKEKNPKQYWHIGGTYDKPLHHLKKSSAIKESNKLKKLGFDSKIKKDKAGGYTVMVKLKENPKELKPYRLGLWSIKSTAPPYICPEGHLTFGPGLCPICGEPKEIYAPKIEAYPNPRQISNPPPIRKQISIKDLKLGNKVTFLDKNKAFRAGKITKIYSKDITITDKVKKKRKVPKKNIIAKYHRKGYYPIKENKHLKQYVENPFMTSLVTGLGTATFAVGIISAIVGGVIANIINEKRRAEVGPSGHAIPDIDPPKKWIEHTARQLLSSGMKNKKKIQDKIINMWKSMSYEQQLSIFNKEYGVSEIRQVEKNPKKGEYAKYPKNLKKLTKKQHKEIVNKLSKLSLKELRRRQDITNKQLELAYNKRDTKALDNLNVMWGHLREAIEKKEFGARKNPKNPLGGDELAMLNHTIVNSFNKLKEAQYKTSKPEVVSNPKKIKMKQNPELTEKQIKLMEETFKDFHDFNPKQIKYVRFPDPKCLVKIGGFKAIGYRSNKWTKNYVDYIHEWEKSPSSKGVVAVDPTTNPPTLVAWTKCRVRPEGITDV